MPIIGKPTVLLGRCCLDSNGTWDNLLSRILAYTPWKEHTGNGHYFDLDMLEFGEMSLFRSELTDDEKIVAYTARILLLSPIQLSCRIGGLTEFELDLICNEEVIALHQDGLMHASTLIDADALLYTYAALWKTAILPWHFSINFPNSPGALPMCFPTAALCATSGAERMRENAPGCNIFCRRIR